MADFKLIVYRLPKEMSLLPHSTAWHCLEAFLQLNSVQYKMKERNNVPYMSSSGSSPLVVVHTPKQELLLESFDQVVTFLQGQLVVPTVDQKDLGKHTACFTMAQSAFSHAENYLQWLMKENSRDTSMKISLGLPWPLNHVVSLKTRLTYWWNHHEMSQESEESIVRRYREVCKALETVLGEKDCFFAGPSSLDALVWGHLEGVISCHLPANPLLQVLQSSQSLKKLYVRIKGDPGLGVV